MKTSFFPSSVSYSLFPISYSIRSCVCSSFGLIWLLFAFHKASVTNTLLSIRANPSVYPKEGRMSCEGAPNEVLRINGQVTDR
ncbi:MAG: hypothetical protein ACOYVG_04965 [Bacteroidota bacterium]